MFNTPENRIKFVNKFQYSKGGYSVDDASAKKMLNAFDKDFERYQNKDKLWSFIMQDRVTFMIGNRVLDKQTKRVGPKTYAKIANQVATEVLDFINGLK